MIRQANINDIQPMRDLIQHRIDWMNEKDIPLWNVFDYLDLFDVEYFEKNIQSFYVYEENNQIVGCVAIYEDDEYWNNYPTKKAFYIHHLTSHTAYKGVGKQILIFVEKMAKNHQKEVLRLDCKEEIDDLNAYYQALGFNQIGTLIDGPYHGILREKKIK